MVDQSWIRIDRKPFKVISSDSTVDDSNTEEASEKDPEDEDSILSDAKTGETNTPSNITTPVTDNPPNELYSRNFIGYDKETWTVERGEPFHNLGSPFHN